ncbi:hypothetical protein [Roseomonas sp. CECT 9278]|uniref:hypothetical protein n=1 Tax=Roseomonadaceae TaxID=3385906 RepID=UPI001E4C388C|nr:hypothetical protein [Roseomonas sp. CECT 9278]CAH0178842.1 hypothetical protein ROS9278_01389 [Roseomonas sp. CECT 9278]
MTRGRNATAPLILPEAEERYGHYIREALTTEGGHLAIGRGGFTLYFARGAFLSGHDYETIKTACIAAGLPVIDSRALPFEVVCDLAVRGPMVAVGEPASAPPWGAFSYAPLAAIADAYRAAGAEVWNLPPVVMAARRE